MSCYSCDDCKKSLDGQLMVTLSLHEETLGQDSIIRVHDARLLLLYCPECAGRRDFDRLTIPLVDTSNRTTSPDEDQNRRDGTPVGA